MRRSDLADLTAFVAVAEHLSFRAAASRLGVTPSALSHTIRQMEERLGVRLFQRTTRSVSLTDAGLRLLERLKPAIDQIGGALEALAVERTRPFGKLRICAPLLAAAAIIEPIWNRFLSMYPEIHLEVWTSEKQTDLVANGFDAGIGFQEWASAEMVTKRVMGPLAVAVVGAPSYFARQRPPRLPDDLHHHTCVEYRQVSTGTPFEWLFERNGKEERIPVNGRVMVNNPYLAVRAAVDGLGIAYSVETLVIPYLRNGHLIRVLDDWSPHFEGLFLYYPAHKQISATLRAFIDSLEPALLASSDADTLMKWPGG